MTEEKFKDGVRSYLKTYQYGNAETKDLWASLTTFATLPENLTISKIMDTWTTQDGYPVVKFDGKTITQERFFLNASGKSMLKVDFLSSFFGELKTLKRHFEIN